MSKRYCQTLIPANCVCAYLQVIQHLQRGAILDCPRVCSGDIYKIMLGCWRRQPTDRLTMREIEKCLKAAVTAASSSYIEVIG